MKKIIFLGAAPHQIPAINEANNLGFKVITVDNRPDNPGHRLAYRSYSNVSTLDKEKVLEIAKDNNANGILSYASDVAMPTSIYVAQNLGLKHHPQKCIEILTNKNSFRKFLVANKLLPDFFFEEFSEYETGKASAFAKSRNCAMVIKPVDSSGSKGVSILSKIDGIEVEKAIKSALNFSISKKIIIEKFISKKGPQICGDGYFENGKIKFVHFGDGQFYEGIHAPYGEIFPSTHTLTALEKTKELLTNVLNLSGFWKGTFNLDVIIDEFGNPFIIELGPRSGGNFIPDATFLQTNINMTKSIVQLASDSDHTLDINDFAMNFPVVACYMVHCFHKMKFDKIQISERIKDNILQINPYINSGSVLDSFKNSSHVAANVILKFNNIEEAQTIWKIMPELIRAEGGLL